MPIKYCLIIILLIIATTIPGLGKLEFFRHTEADRTLISQEMLENSNYVVPHILGQPILTKPPIYYILSAQFFKLTGASSEFEARLISVFAACLLASTHLLAASYGYKNTMHGLGSALVLISTLGFFNLAAVAEIDMLYAAFCAVSLYLLFFSFEKKSLSILVFAYIFAAIAFLTKGPPIIVFFALSSLLYNLFFKQQSLKAYLLWNAIGVFSFLAVVGIWVIPLISQIDLAILKEQFYQEIWGRAVGQPRKYRSVLFYFGSVLGATLPWNLPFILLLVFKRHDIKKINISSFIKFSLIVFLSGLALLSLANGKSSRYIFPLHSFAVQILYYYLVAYQESSLSDKVKSIIKISFAITILAVVCLAIFVSIKLGFQKILYSIPTLLLLVYAFRITEIRKQFVAFAISVLCFRYVLVYVYYPLRNSEKSVKPIVESIIEESKSLPIYSAAMYERWVSFYLKAKGIPVLQLQGLKTYQPKYDKLYWLVTDKDENDLLTLIKKDPTSSLIKVYQLPNTKMYFYLTETKQVLSMIEQIKKTRKDDGIF